MDIGECYLILGLDHGASEDEIKSAYRKLAKQYHPDKTQGDEFLSNMFKKIHTAYETLLSRGSGNSRSSYEEPSSAKSSRPAYNATPVLRQWVADYQKGQQRLSDEQYNLKRVQSIQNIKHLSVQNLLKVIGLAVLVSLFFYPERLKSNRKQPLQQVNKSGWVLKNEASLYRKPDMKTKVLTSLKVGVQLDSIGETKYYYKVRSGSGTTKITGYILKDKIGN